MERWTPPVCWYGAPVAQWIEHLTTDQKVGGSTPSRRAELPRLPHRLADDRPQSIWRRSVRVRQVDLVVGARRFETLLADEPCERLDRRRLVCVRPHVQHLRASPLFEPLEAQ